MSIIRDQNSNKWPCSIIVMCLRLYHVTSILHCRWWEFWSRDTDVYLTCIRFGILLTLLCQFLETGTSDKCPICIVQLLRFSGFILYPISFFIYSPFNETVNVILRDPRGKDGNCAIYNSTKA